MFKLVSVDNPASAGNAFVGMIAPFNYNGRQFFFDDLYSSLVFSIVYDQGTVTVKTLNSLYVFELQSDK